jgi:capsid protein
MGWLSTWRLNRAKSRLHEQYMHARADLMVKAVRHQEHMLDYYSGIIDPSSGFEDWYYIGGGLGNEHGHKGALDNFGLAEMRRVGRDLDWNNPYGKAFGLNIVNYVIGKTGMTASLSAPEDPDPQFTGISDDEWKDVIAETNQHLKRFAKANKWVKLQRECCRNVHRDGDYFIREFVDSLGMTHIRTIDPGQVRPDRENRWPDGIITDPVDRQLVLAYLVDGEPVNASEVHHLKLNTDIDVLRGVPTMWSARENCLRGAKIVRNMAHVTEILAAIAAVEKFDGPIGSGDLGNFLDNLADKTSKTDVETGKIVRQRKIQPGSFLSLPRGQSIESNLDGRSLPGIVGARADILRTIAAEIAFPEFLLTADASNNNYASIREASAPATKNFQAQQGVFEEFFGEIVTSVIRNGILLGVLRPAAAALEVAMVGPQVEVNDKLKAAQTREIDMRVGILSHKTATEERGDLDFEEEQANILAHAERMAPGRPLPSPPDDEEPDDEPQDDPASQAAGQSGGTK